MKILPHTLTQIFCAQARWRLLMFPLCWLIMGATFDFEAYLQNIEDLGLVGGLVVVLTYALIVPLVLPGGPITLGTGFIYGPIWGTLFVAVGTAIGAGIAFLLGRHLVGHRVRRKIEKFPKMLKAERAVAVLGWKVVLLSRMVPFFPFKLSNYAFGVTKIPLGKFMSATALGILPITLLNCYIGSLAKDLSSLGQTPDGDKTSLYFSIGGLIVLVVLVTLMGRQAKKIWNEEVESMPDEEVG